MKKLLFIAILGISLIAQAQRGNSPETKMNDFTPEQQAVLKTKKMVLHLDLNDQQRDKLMEVNKRWAEKRSEERAKMKAQLDKEEKPDADTRYAHQVQMLDNQLMYQNEVKKILNEEQYASWKEHQMRRGDRSFRGKNHPGNRHREKSRS